MFNNGPINKYAKVISFNTLLISKAVAKHTGLYSCRGWKRKLGFHTQFLATAELRVFGKLIFHSDYGHNNIMYLNKIQEYCR